MRPIPPHSLPLFQNVGTVQRSGDDSSCVCGRRACAKFRVVEVLLLILKAFKHSHSALAHYMLLHWLDASFCVQQQIGLLLLPVADPPIVSSYPHRTRHPPPPQHSASHGLWVVPVYHTTRRHIREYRALNISILTLRFHLLFKTLNNHDTTFHVRFVSPGYVALLIVVQDSLSENKMLYQRH